MDRQTDMTQIPSPQQSEWLQRVPACPSEALGLSVAQPAPVSQESQLPGTAGTQQGHPALTEVNSWPFPGQPSLQSHLGTQLKRSAPLFPFPLETWLCSPWKSRNFLSFSSFSSPLPCPAVIPHLSGISHWNIVSLRKAKMLKLFPGSMKGPGPEKVRRGKDKEG